MNRTFNMKNSKTLCLCVSVVLLGLLGCSKKQEQQAAPQSPQKYNVVLISIDTLRADYLRLYSAQGIQTPHLEKLATESILFRKVISQIPYTLPSHCTMLTGTYPIAHKVRDNLHDILPKNIPTLAELFKKEGYETAGFIGSMVLSRQTGLGKGFDYYDDYFSMADTHGEDLGGIERRADDVFASFQNWVDKRPGTGPFFTFVHFYDPHTPYEPPPQFSPAKKELTELYKGEIRYVDSVLGKLFAYLQNKNLWSNTVVLVTSDHGEMLNEHHEAGHGFFLYRAALEVPLLIHLPNTPAKEIPETVQLVDIAPTLLSLVGARPPGGMQGESLLPLITRNSQKKNRLGFSESYFAAIQLGISPLQSVQDESFKYIDSPKPELYNLKNDPNESKNLIQEKKDLAQQMKQNLVNYQKVYESPKMEEAKRSVSAEEAEQFAAIGYLGGKIAESEWNKGKDPKDYIEKWNTALEATYLVGQKQYAKALTLINSIESALPAGQSSNSIPPGKSVLAFSIALQKSKCYGGLKEYEKAKQALTQAGELPEVFTGLAHIYAVEGKYEKANELYQKALDLQFSYFTLHNYILFLKETGNREPALKLLNRVQQTRDPNSSRPFLSEMYFLLEDWNNAEKMLDTLVQERPWEVKWYIQLADVLSAEGQSQRALTLMKDNYERFSSNADYLLSLGVLYHSSGQPASELEAYKQMIRVDPNDSRGYFYCAKSLLEQNGDLNAVISLAMRGLNLQPDLSFQIVGHRILAKAYSLAGKAEDSQKESEIAKKLEQGA
jgi:arylsulfatase A-like enzyme/Tfp pilus assembly protein PilF